VLVALDAEFGKIYGSGGRQSIPTPIRKYPVSLLTTALHCGYPDA
jgi:hypothetical protein